jgi:CTP:molybdopterin cytidylyltransferase MocA
MGTQKLLLPFRGKPLLAWTLDLVGSLPVGRRLIVLGAHADTILKKLFCLPSFPPSTRHASRVTSHGSSRHASRVTRHGIRWEVLINRGWEEGMGSSLRLAARHVDGGMLVFLGDMPLVPREAALAVLFRAKGRPAAPIYRGQRGFPVYLPAKLRPQLLGLRGDIGARWLISRDYELIPVDDPGVTLDIDDEASLAAVGGELRGREPHPL